MTRKNLTTIRNGLVSGFAAYLGAHALFAVAVTAAYYLLVPFAHAQTYVRPSKGAAVALFTTAPVSPNVWAGYPSVLNANAIDSVTQGYDWTAFEAVQVRITGTGGAPGCTSQVAQYAVTNLAPYVRFRIKKPASSDDLRFQIEDSPLKDPATSYVLSFSPNADFLTTSFAGCSISVSVVPTPFAQPTNSTSLKDGTVVGGGITNSTPNIIGGVDPATGQVTTLAVDRTTRALKVDASGGGTSTVTVTNAFALNSTVATGNSSLATIVTNTGNTATNTSNTATNTSTIAGRLPTTLGQKASSASLAVVLPNDQTVPVSGTVGISGTVPVSGTVTAQQPLAAPRLINVARDSGGLQGLLDATPGGGSAQGTGDLRGTTYSTAFNTRMKSQLCIYGNNTACTGSWPFAGTLSGFLTPTSASTDNDFLEVRVQNMGLYDVVCSIVNPTPPTFNLTSEYFGIESLGQSAINFQYRLAAATSMNGGDGGVLFLPNISVLSARTSPLVCRSYLNQNLPDACTYTSDVDPDCWYVHVAISLYQQ